MSDPRVFGGSSNRGQADQPYEVETYFEDCFVIYSSHAYRTARRANQLARENKAANETISEENDCFPIKIHISISEDNVASVHLVLIQILLNAMAEGIINQFKHTHLDTVIKQLAYDENGIAQAKLFKSYLSEEMVEIPSTEEKIARKWKELRALFKDSAYGRYSDEDLLDKIDRDAKESKESMVRLMTGSQFTVYLPMKYSIANIANLQNNISKTLIEKKVSPGKMVPTQSPINRFVSIRLDNLDGDYISALVSDKETLDRLHVAQTSSELFQYLRVHANDDPIPLKKREFDIRQSAHAQEDPFKINRDASSTPALR